MGCIYMRTSPSGKSYIGQTLGSEIERWKEHCYLALQTRNPTNNYPLSRAIRKYGPDSFTCTILEDNIDDPDLLSEREKYWISYYGTYSHGGLNATRGGDGNPLIDTKEVKRLWDEGYCVRDLSILLNIDSVSALRHLNMTAQECEKRGPVYKTKNSYKYFGDMKTGKAAPISCFDKKTGQFVRSFRSSYEAMKFVNANTSSAILRAINGCIKSAFGYLWRAGSDQTPFTKEELENKTGKRKLIKQPVVCIETNSMYSDTVYAEKCTGICYRSICFVCKGMQKTAGGYHWRYATDDDKLNMQLLCENKPHRPAHNRRKVLCVETGEIYDSLELAGQSVGSNNKIIYNCCAGKAKTAAGFHWKYYDENNISSIGKELGLDE